MSKKAFLVVHDYGQGGVWAYVRATSKEQIQRRLPGLEVVDRPPSWMTREDLARIEQRMTFDIDDAGRGLLGQLRRGGSRRLRKTAEHEAPPVIPREHGSAS